MSEEVALLVFRSHGWLVRYDGEQWIAVDESNKKIVGADNIINRIAVSAAMARQNHVR